MRWFRPRKVYVVWESNPDLRGAAAMEHIFYSERKCLRHVKHVQSEWAKIDVSVEVYYTIHFVIG